MHKLDLSLLVLLLLHVGTPSATTKKHLHEIRSARNGTSHLPNDRLDDKTFNDLCGRVSSALATSFGADPVRLKQIAIADADADITKVLESDETTRKRAVECKEAGNRLFLSANYEEAIKFYTEGLQLSGALSTERQADFWANRSVSYGKLGKWQDALDDATQATRLNPVGMRGHQRMGDAQKALGQYAEAAVSYERALVY